MNEFNRANTSARATDQAYIDEGLRAHMLRIYNYMTAALSLCLLYTSDAADE